MAFVKVEVTQERCADLFIELPEGVQWGELSPATQKRIALQAALEVAEEEWASSNDLLLDWWSPVDEEEALSYGTYTPSEEELEETTE